MRATLALAVAALALVPSAFGDAVYHSAHIALSPTGGASLRAGFVQNIHADGPNIFAHEQYVLNGAGSNTTYTVVIHVSAASDTSCAAPFLNLATATLTTNVAGNGSAYHVFTPSDVGGLANSTINAYWTVELNGSVAYRTDCVSITLDS
jgi:hypothetical protein